MAASRKPWLYALPVIVFIGLALVLGLGLRNDPKLLPSALLNKPMPPFKAELLKAPGTFIDQQALHGKVALLNVWATWCPSCKEEHAYLNDLKQRGVIIYGVNYKDERAAAVSWLQRYGDPYRLNVYDEKGQLGVDLGVYGAPETYLIDAKGIIHYRHIGPLYEAVWQKEFLPRIAMINGGAG